MLEQGGIVRGQAGAAARAVNGFGEAQLLEMPGEALPLGDQRVWNKGGLRCGFERWAEAAQHGDEQGAGQEAAEVGEVVDLTVAGVEVLDEFPADPDG